MESNDETITTFNFPSLAFEFKWCGKFLESNDETMTKLDFPSLAYKYLVGKNIL